MTNLFGGGSQLNVNVSGTLIPQVFVPTNGQTLFNITNFTYAVGSNSLLVFVNGIKKTLATDFTETSSSSFTLATAVTAADKVEIIGFPQANVTQLAGNVVGNLTVNGITTLVPPLTPASGGTGGNLGTAGGAALVKFQQVGSTVLRDLQAKNQELVSALDFGQVVSSSTPYPYVAPAAPVDTLRGDPWEKFSLTLAKVLNFTDYPNFKLNQRAKAAFNSGTVTISIVGDSITAGADNWRSNSYVTLLKTQLKQAFPWITFIFQNYAIGGMSASTLTSGTYVGAANLGAYSISVNYWFTPNPGGPNVNTTYAPTGYALLDEENWPLGSTPGKTWKQQIIDSNPDIIVYAFGMNDGTDYDAFKTAYDSFQATIAGAFSSSLFPWFVLVSCFLPSKIPPAGQPHATWQVPAQSMADSVKYWAAESGYGLIDANSVFNFLRDGLRKEYLPYTHEANWRYATDVTKWTWQGGFSYNAGAVRGEGTGMAMRSVATRDLDFSATFQVTAFTGGNFVARIGYRDVLGAIAGGGGNRYSADIVMNNASNLATAILYYGSTPIASQTYNMGAPSFVGHIFSLKVKAYGDRHEIWLNNQLLIDYVNANSMYANSVQVGIPLGVGYVTYLGLSYAPQWAETPTHVDKKWLLGTPIYDGGGNFVAYGDFIYSNPDSMGGNVVNHPTAWGHNTFYGFGISKFVQELKQRVNAPISIIKRGNATFTNTAAANTPQLVTAVPAITFKPRPSTSGVNCLVTLHIPYSITAPTGYPQFGVMVNGVHASSQFVAQSVTLNLVTLKFVINLASIVNTIQVDCVRSAITETLTVNPTGGTEASIIVQEVDL